MTEPNASWLEAGVMGALPDLLIALALLSFALASITLVFRRKDANSVMGWVAGSLILFCVALSLVHLTEAWSVWQSRETGMAAKTLAAFAGLAAALGLWRAVPALRSLPSRAELQASSAALARAERELEAFTASVSHDLRSPLTSIAGQAGMLELTLSENATDDQRRRLQRMQGSVKQMSELIDALVMLSRTARQPIQPESVDLTALAEQIVADLRRRDPGREVTVTIQPNMTARGDRRLLADAFTQLIDNAWKFTSRSPAARIEIGQSAGADDALAAVYVRDNGAGFDMAYGDKLFQPFKRLHGPNEFAGAGVGLATVSRIVERHGGRIRAEAKPNEGAVFHIELPRA